jgi:hypothetical protein
MVWGALTLLVVASAIVIYLRLGSAGLGNFIQQPPLINLPVTLSSVALLWLSAGILLFLVQAGRIRIANVPATVGFLLVLWSYLNFLSERWRYGDYTYYWESARTMYANQPLHGSYFYPPLWATLTQFLVPAGEGTFFIVLWLLNVVSLALFFVLLHKVLQRYGFSTHFAALVVTLFMLANAPLLRTLVYVQVNLHTLNFILLALLLYPRHSFLSALALAIAAHLKGSPAVLVLAFLLEKDWRWLAWFVLTAALIAGLTVVTDGISPFLDVLRHLQDLALSGNTIFHDTSFDSFLRFSLHLLSLDESWSLALAYAAKALLAAASIAVMLLASRRQVFVRSTDAGSHVLNGIPPLFILMTLASPVVWEHHGIFLALPFLLMLKRLETPHEWLWFGFAYLLEFPLPTFDFFPWSFGRLIAPLLVLWQMWRTAPRERDSTTFTAFNEWLGRLPIPKPAV